MLVETRRKVLLVETRGLFDGRNQKGEVVCWSKPVMGAILGRNQTQV